MKRFPLFFPGFILAGVVAFGGCSAGGNSGTSPIPLGPTACADTCAECSPVPCPCADGESVNLCACASGTTVLCANESVCASTSACDDHGGPAGNNPGEDAGKKTDASSVTDSGFHFDAKVTDSSSNVPSKVITTGKMKPVSPISSGGFWYLVFDVSPMTYTPDGIGPFKFAGSGFSSTDNVAILDTPSKGACTNAEVKVGLGLGNATVSASGTDSAGSTACKDFINSIAKSGLHAHVTNAKFQGWIIPTLDIVLSGP